MIMNLSQRLIQCKRIAVLTDLGSDSEKMVLYAASLARLYGSELSFFHAASGSASKRNAEEKLKSLINQLNIQDFAPNVVTREASMETILEEVDEYRPSLLVLATRGKEGIRKWLAGSVAEAAFRKVQWPVLVLGPEFSAVATPQKQFERILYSTDLSPVSVTALQYAAGISHDHRAQLTALYVESDPELGFSFDRAMAQQRMQDWTQDHIDGLSEASTGVRYVVEFGKPETKIVEAAMDRKTDLVVLGARGLGGVSGPASHFLGGTAYGVCCSSKVPGPGRASTPLKTVPFDDSDHIRSAWDVG
jgi:nucleotide-binding universal stress UspA family protein